MQFQLQNLLTARSPLTDGKETEMKILITGGAGFIGTKLIDKINEKDMEIVILDNLLDTVHNGQIPEIAKGVKLVKGDVANGADWDVVLKDFTPDVIIHLAAETGTGTSLSQPTIHTNTNVNGTAMLIEKLQQHKIVPKKIILTSSRAVYGEGAYTQDSEIIYPRSRTKKDLESEKFDFNNSDGSKLEFHGHQASSTVPYPTNVYAATKLAQEHLLESYCSSFGVSLAILRLQNVYGEGQSLTNPYTGILVQFVRAALSDQTINIYENGGITRDFVHVDDVCQSIERALSNDQDYLKVDIGTGLEMKIEDVAQLMIKITSSNSSLDFVPLYRAGDVRHAFANISEANSILGYSPQVTIEAGLTSFIKWSRETI